MKIPDLKVPDMSCEMTDFDEVNPRYPLDLIYSFH